MKKLAFAATTAALILCGPTLAFAAEQWLVTEENTGGVKGGQGIGPSRGTEARSKEPPRSNRTMARC